jgi:hypothetical protein
MSNKVGGMFLDSLSNLMAAVAAVAAVWLLLRDMGIGMNMQGFANDGSSGASMRFDGVRSDGYSDASTLVLSPSIPAKQGFLGNQEQPVFWNAGDMVQIANAQVQSMPNETLDGVDMPASGVRLGASGDVMAGFAARMDYAGRPVYNGFAGSRVPVYQGFEASAGQFSTINRDGAIKVLTGY